MKTIFLLRNLAILFVSLACASCAEPNSGQNPAIVTDQELSEGVWSTNPELFHTEGDFKNGTIWQISSNGQKFSIWTSDGIYQRRRKLSGYFEALQLSEELKNKGYVCDRYDYSY